MNYCDVRYSNAPAFQAQLRVKGLKLDAEKLAQVNEIVMNKSQHYADDVLELSEFSVQRDDGSFFKSTNFEMNGIDVGVAVSKDFKDFFENNSVNDVAKALLRVFKKGKANEIFENRIGSITKNIRSAMVGKLESAEKFNAAFERDNYSEARVQRNLLTSYRNRINTLKEQRKNLENLHEEISEKITDTPISSIVYWD
jgi:ABC-type oligopeptide transport system ATPase subunit